MTEHRVRPLDQRIPPLTQRDDPEQMFTAAFIALDRAMQNTTPAIAFPQSVPHQDRVDTPDYPVTALYLLMLLSMWDRRILPRHRRDVSPIAYARQQLLSGEQ